ncbi:MAG: transporter substrate-binding domain-containing protein [Burkholderiales bacterium]|nr:transporter substrate-binding domain-containing protein [Burkholderiales bacterium]
MKAITRRVWWVLASCATWSLHAEGLVLDTEDYPPFNMRVHEQVGGLSTDLLREALRRAGIQAEFRIVPLARAIMESRYNADHCVYSVVRSAQRETWYKWVAPLAEDKITLFARADSPIQLDSFADAKRYRVGGYMGDAYGDYVERQGVVLDRAASDVLNIQKLLTGRIDLWVGGSVSVPYRMMLDGRRNAVKPIISGGEERDGQMWLACHPATNDELIGRLRTALKSVEADGTAALIVSRYR